MARLPPSRSVLEICGSVGRSLALQFTDVPRRPVARSLRHGLGVWSAFFIGERQMRILDVGQCGIDGPAIAELLKKELGAKVDTAPTADDARSELAEHDYDLVLVNRIFAADGSKALDLMDELVREASPAPVMLVSDREDAQSAAVAKGAIRGFGKSALDDAATLNLIKSSVRDRRR